MKVLVACEFSQIVCKAFRDKGHEAYSCDLLPTEGNPRWHIQDDVLKHLGDGWDLMIAHPPCTYMSKAGIGWYYHPTRTQTIKQRFESLELATKFFNQLLSAPINKICIENPILNTFARKYIRPPDQIVQPAHFGDNYMKQTCLWLIRLPPLMATLIYPQPQRFVNSGSAYRQGLTIKGTMGSKNRSRTFYGIAKAMAEQWGQFIVRHWK